MDSAIQPDDYVHHGQGDNLLGHGREQGTQWLDEQRRDDPVILLCIIQFGSTGLVACQGVYFICHFRPITYASFATWTIYKHERRYSQVSTKKSYDRIIRRGGELELRYNGSQT